MYVLCIEYLLMFLLCPSVCPAVLSIRRCGWVKQYIFKKKNYHQYSQLSFLQPECKLYQNNGSQFYIGIILIKKKNP